LYLTERLLAIEPKNLRLQIFIKRDIPEVVVMEVWVPPGSQIESSERVRINQHSDTGLRLWEFSFGPLFILAQGSKEDRLARQFEEFSQVVTDKNNTLVQVLQYLQVFKLLPDSQLIAATMLVPNQEQRLVHSVQSFVSVSQLSSIPTFNQLSFRQEFKSNQSFSKGLGIVFNQEDIPGQQIDNQNHILHKF
jgi:hypothetical protein